VALARHGESRIVSRLRRRGTGRPRSKTTYRLAAFNQPPFFPHFILPKPCNSLLFKGFRRLPHFETDSIYQLLFPWHHSSLGTTADGIARPSDRASDFPSHEPARATFVRPKSFASR
jgi:hypothetical protein